MIAGIAAFRSGTPPHILQVADLGALNIMAAEVAVYPVYYLKALFEKITDIHITDDKRLFKCTSRKKTITS